jgi:hypothetical protein
METRMVDSPYRGNCFNGLAWSPDALSYGVGYKGLGFNDPEDFRGVLRHRD